MIIILYLINIIPSTRSRWFGSYLEIFYRVKLIFLIGVLHGHKFFEAVVQAWVELVVLAALLLLRQWTEQYILVLRLGVILWLKRKILYFQVLGLDLWAVLGVRDHRWSLHLLTIFDVREALELLEVNLAQLVEREILVNDLMENWCLTRAQLVLGLDLPLVWLFWIIELVSLPFLR